MVLDGTPEASEAAVSMLHWDVSNGVTRRAWAGHPLARQTIAQTQETVPGYRITQCNVAEDALVENL